MTPRLLFAIEARCAPTKAALTKPSAGRRQQTASAFFSGLGLELELDAEGPASPPIYVLTSFITVFRELPASSSILSRLLLLLLPDTARDRADAHRQYWNSSPGMILRCPQRWGWVAT